MINRQVFSAVYGQYENDKNVVFDLIDQAVSLFSQLYFVAATQVTVQLRPRNMGLLQTFFSAAYATADKDALSLLQGLDLIPVQRNVGIDAFLKISNESSLVPVRVQRQGEALSEAAHKLHRAAKSKNSIKAILIRTLDFRLL